MISEVTARVTDVLPLSGIPSIWNSTFSGLFLKPQFSLMLKWSFWRIANDLNSTLLHSSVN